jgi:HSP20 family protein
MVSRFPFPRTDAGAPEPLGTLHREVNRVFDEVMRGFPTLRAAVGDGFLPRLEARETAEALELTAELPGIAEQDVDLRLEGDLLTLSGEKRESRTAAEGETHLAERSYGRFQRSFRLPFAPEPGAVTAEFDRGVLTVRLPRPARAEAAANRIPIRSGAATPPSMAGGATTEETTGGQATG